MTFQRGEHIPTVMILKPIQRDFHRDSRWSAYFTAYMQYLGKHMRIKLEINSASYCARDFRFDFSYDVRIMCSY